MFLFVCSGLAADTAERSVLRKEGWGSSGLKFPPDWAGSGEWPVYWTAGWGALGLMQEGPSAAQSSFWINSRGWGVSRQGDEKCVRMHTGWERQKEKQAHASEEAGRFKRRWWSEGQNRNYTFSKVRWSHLLEEVTTSQDAPILANVRKFVPGPSRGKSQALVMDGSLLRCRMRAQAGLMQMKGSRSEWSLLCVRAEMSQRASWGSHTKGLPSIQEEMTPENA